MKGSDQNPHAGARMTATVLPVTVSMRVYFSSYHLWAAKHFSKLTAQLEERPGKLPRFDIEHRAFATNTILSSVAFLEAAINELFQDAADGHESYLKTVDSKLVSDVGRAWTSRTDRRAVLGKYALASDLLRIKSLDPRAEPYTSTELVIQLRNILVHYRPSSRSAHDMSSFEESLKVRFPENKLMNGSGNPFFPDKCLGAGCASWAVSAVENLASEFFKRLGIQPNFKRVAFSSPRGEGA